MPITLATLFCMPQDIWDVLSVYGVDLRLDDNNLASGYIVQTTADANVNDTSVAVAALPAPLLRGAVLTFDCAGVNPPVQVSLTAAAGTGATSISVASVTSLISSGAQARDSGVNASTAARLLVGCRKGTSKVKLYCNARYDDAQLKLSGSVLDWAALYGSWFLCTRRAQATPKGLKEQLDLALEEMRQVQAGQLAIEDIGTRGVDWPTVTNVRVDPGYDYMRARVESNISEGTPTGYSQYIDWNSAVWLEW